MDLEAAERLQQRATLTGIVQQFHEMFMESLYCGQQLAQLGEAGEECCDSYSARYAYWNTSIWRREDMQPCVKWKINFRTPLFGALTIEFSDGELRTILWEREGWEDWHLNTLRKQRPPLIDSDTFLRFIHRLSTTITQYVKLHRLPCRGAAAHLLQVLE